MRAFIYAILLTLLAQPVWAFDCDFIRMSADTAFGNYRVFDKKISQTFKNIRGRLPTSQERADIDLLRKMRDDHFEDTKDFAVIYAAFCKEQPLRPNNQPRD